MAFPVYEVVTDRTDASITIQRTRPPNLVILRRKIIIEHIGLRNGAQMSQSGLTLSLHNSFHNLWISR